MFQKIFRKINNKYFYALVGFIVWIAFFDNNNLVSRFKMKRTLKSSRQQKEFYLEEIRKDSQMIHELIYDSAALEKFGREQYLMKKDNEDIFLVVKQNAEKK